MKSETRGGFKSNDCCMYLLKYLHLENLEIISEEKFTGLMKDVFDEIMEILSDVSECLIKV